MNGRATVLVVDDEPGIRDMLSFELAQEGFEVETAADGLAALQALRRRKFDLAITDLKMPGMDGVATLEALRDADPDLEVIVATGYASVETAVACMKRGAYDYIQKPYDVRELTLLLERAAEKSHLQGLVTLYEASRALFATLKHEDLAGLVVALAQRVLRADDAGLVLWGGAREEYEVRRANGDDSASQAQLLELARRAEEARAPLRVRRASGASSGSKDDAPGYALVYPLTARDRWLGALVVLRRPESREFSPSELQRGTILANQLALSLDNARLYQELEARIGELIATREHLVNTEKLAMAGELAGAVAHEVNNPLSFVVANLKSLQDYSSQLGALWLAAKGAAQYLRAQPGHVAQEHAGRLCAVDGSDERTDGAVREIAQMVDEILEGVKRIAELVSGFARLAGMSKPTQAQDVDLGEVVRECVAALPGAGDHVQLDQGGAAEIRASASREDLRAALLNLMTFLLAAGRRRSGPPQVTIRALREREGPIVAIGDVTLTPTDEELRRIFDPQLELDGRGRTMRLNVMMALTYQILRRNGAELTAVRAEGDRGLLFRIRLARPLLRRAPPEGTPGSIDRALA